METETPKKTTMTLTPEQNRLIDRKSVARQDAITETTWKRRSAGLWGGALVGGLWGVVFGAVALGVAAVALAASPAFAVAGVMSWGLAAGVIGAFAVAGVLAGAPVGAEVGRDAGAVAGGLREQDRAAAARGESIEPVPERDPTLGERLNLLRGSKKIIKWKTALLCGAAGLALGAAFLAVAPGAPLAALGFLGNYSIFGTLAANSAAGAFALKAMVLSTMTLFGAFFATDGPTLIRNATDLMGEVLSGRIWEKKKALSPQSVPEQVQALPRSKQGNQPVVFQNTNLTTQQGAVMDPGYHMRRAMAEQQFQTLTRDQQTAMH